MKNTVAPINDWIFLKFLKTFDYKEENDFLQDLSKNSKTVGWVYEKRHEKKIEWNQHS